MPPVLLETVDEILGHLLDGCAVGIRKTRIGKTGAGLGVVQTLSATSLPTRRGRTTDAGANRMGEVTGHYAGWYEVLRNGQEIPEQLATTRRRSRLDAYTAAIVCPIWKAETRRGPRTSWHLCIPEEC